MLIEFAARQCRRRNDETDAAVQNKSAFSRQKPDGVRRTDQNGAFGFCGRSVSVAPVLPEQGERCRADTPGCVSGLQKGFFSAEIEQGPCGGLKQFIDHDNLRWFVV